MSIRWLSALTIAGLSAGCVTTNLAPGAAQVNITSNAADVAACTALGSIPQGVYLPHTAGNETVALGGNTLFVTREYSSGGILGGIAYRCPAK